MDFTKEVWSAGLRVRKDFNQGLVPLMPLSVPGKIEYIIHYMVQRWQSHLRDIHTAIFNGDEKSLKFLNELLRDGGFSRWNPGGARDFKYQYKKLLYSILIPAAWRIQGYYPVLLDTAFPCNTPGIGVAQWMNSKDIGDQIICNSDRQYQLWGVKGQYGCDTEQPRYSIRTRCNIQLTRLPGLEDICEEIGSWGDLRIFSMVNR
jgi:hypothetical protein